jgi:hypothetical protein
MHLPHLRWSLCGLWFSVTLLTFMLIPASSVRSWLYMMAIAIVPPFVLLSLWNDGPTPTVAELLRSTEQRR